MIVKFVTWVAPSVLFRGWSQSALSIHVYPVEWHAIVKDQHLNEIILGYSHLSPAQIERGIGQIKLAIG